MNTILSANRNAVTILLAVFLLCCAVPVPAGEYYLYAPEPVETPKVPEGPEKGVLTRDITIRRGDTLRALSRKYTGKESYFPQILMFNRIRNPDRIYTGRTLRVPLTLQPTAARVPGVREEKPAAMRHAKSAPAAMPHQEAKTPAPATEGRNQEEKIFETAVRLYRAGQCGEAIDSLTVFLRKYPNSERAAAAMLYRADCYLKLSGR